MNYPETLFLFDVDGVLVEPRGYRRAIQAAVEYFLQSFGLTSCPIPGEDQIVQFEAHNITSEWDMVPLSLAIILNSLLDLVPDPPTPPSLAAAQGWLRNFPCPAEIDYLPYIQAISKDRLSDELPVQTALRLSTVSTDHRLVKQPIFPRLAGSPFLNDLLSGTRSINTSATTAIFQQFVLGSQAFSSNYGLPSALNLRGLLKTEDRPLLSPELIRQIKHYQDLNLIGLAVYTLRPSLPPRGMDRIAGEFSPEAEIALELSGLNQVPIIGYGRIRYLADTYQREVETLIKPSPVQALAAIFAALTQDELVALALAMEAYKQDNTEKIDTLRSALTAPLTIHIFEDSSGGIEAVYHAARLLQNLDIPSLVIAWAIAQHPLKIQALHTTTNSISSSTNLAVEAALQQVLSPKT